MRFARRRDRIVDVPRWLTTVLACIAVGTAAAGSATATPGYNWPGMKKCGSFQSGYRIYVYANRYLTCTRAKRVIKAWWLGPRRTVISHNGGSGANGYYTLTRYPGWRCISGSGGGSCRRGKTIAGYQN